MRLLPFAVALLTLCLACNKVVPPKKFDLDLSEPGTRCEVHKVPLQEEVVPIAYGLRRPTVEQEEAKQKLFPHANRDYNPGCNVKPEKRALVSFCPECRKAEPIWRQAEERRITSLD